MLTKCRYFIRHPIDTLKACRTLSLGAISVDLVIHLQYQFHNFNMAVADMTAVTELVSVKSHNNKEKVETSQL